MITTEQLEQAPRLPAMVIGTLRKAPHSGQLNLSLDEDGLAMAIKQRVRGNNLG